MLYSYSMRTNKHTLTN